MSCLSSGSALSWLQLANSANSGDGSLVCTSASATQPGQPRSCSPSRYYSPYNKSEGKINYHAAYHDYESISSSSSYRKLILLYYWYALCAPTHWSPEQRRENKKWIDKTIVFMAFSLLFVIFTVGPSKLRRRCDIISKFTFTIHNSSRNYSLKISSYERPWRKINGPWPCPESGFATDNTRPNTHAHTEFGNTVTEFDNALPNSSVSRPVSRGRS